MLALFYGLRYSSHQRKLQKQTNSKKIQKNFLFVVASLYDIHHNREIPALCGFLSL